MTELDVAEAEYFKAQLIAREHLYGFVIHNFVAIVFLVGGLAGLWWGYLLAGIWLAISVVAFLFLIRPSRTKKQKAERRFESAMAKPSMKAMRPFDE